VTKLAINDEISGSDGAYQEQKKSHEVTKLAINDEISGSDGAHQEQKKNIPNLYSKLS
jgi:hypothetical protein